MAGQRTRKTRNNRQRYVLYAIPLIALVLVGGVFALSYLGAGRKLCSDPTTASLAENFQTSLSIQIVNKSGNLTRFIAPPSVGVPGGSWATHTFDNLLGDGRYPLCTDPAPTNVSYQGWSNIRVRSTQPMNFSLRDFFNVWGQPLGSNPNGTDQTLNSAYVLQTPGYVWQMCIGNPTNTANLRFGNWTYQPLYADEFITLVYYSTTSSYPGCIG